MQGKHIVGKILLQNNKVLDQTPIPAPSPPLVSPSTATATTFEMNSFKSSGGFLSSLKQQKGSQAPSYSSSSSSSTYSPGSGSSGATLTTNKSESSSILKNKMRRLISRLPSSHSSPQSLFASSGCSHQVTHNVKKASSPPPPPPLPLQGLLKFNRTQSSLGCKQHQQQQQQQQQTSCGSGSSSTDESSSSASNLVTPPIHSSCFPCESSSSSSSSSLLCQVENTTMHVYTETKLPPRILRKYQKQRAMTEAIAFNHADQSNDDNHNGNCKNDRLDQVDDG